MADKENEIDTTEGWWMPYDENTFPYFKQYNPINVFEYLNNNLENPNQMLERLERIEKKLDALIDKEK